MSSMAQRKPKTTKRNLPLFLMAVPGILYLLINNYIPMIGVFLAFKEYNFVKGMFGSDWVGLKNFKYLFSNDAFVITRNTILYNVVFIVIGTIMAIFIAILMSEIRTTIRAKFFQASLLLPNLLSWVVVGFIGYAFLNTDAGFINSTVMKFFGKDFVSWYTTSKFWPYILTFVYLWKNAGYSSIIYMASIAGIDDSVYEAADLDGATKMQQVFHITLPMLKPTVIILTLMSVGRIFFSDFGLFYQVPMNSGAIFNVTQTIDTYVYRGLMETNDVGMSAAAGLYQSLVGFILVMGANAFVRKVDKNNALF